MDGRTIAGRRDWGSQLVMKEPHETQAGIEIVAAEQTRVEGVVVGRQLAAWC
jgi:hypothetical protein